MKGKKVVAVIQARMSSSRLPGKVLLPLKRDYRVLDSVYKRVMKSIMIDNTVIAISNDSSDDCLYEFCENRDYSVFRGSLDDVLKRVYYTADQQNADIVVRVTADCPLVAPYLIDDVIKFYNTQKFDYAGVKRDSIALGLSAEVISFDVLKKAYQEAEKPHREHVTSYIYSNSQKFNCGRMFPGRKYRQTKNYRLTLDTEADYRVLKDIFYNLGGDFISIRKLTEYLHENPEIASMNSDVQQKGIYD